MRDDTTLPGRLRDILVSYADRVTKAARITEAVRIAGEYRWVGLYDVDLRHGLVANISWSGPSAPAYPIFPVTRGLTSRAVAEKHTINVGDVAGDPAYLTALLSTCSEIIIPVLNTSGTVVGTLDVESEQPDAFDPAAQSLLEQCAQVLAPFWMMSPGTAA